jgi:hypothetical protein
MAFISKPQAKGKYPEIGTGNRQRLNSRKRGLATVNRGLYKSGNMQQ